MFAPAALAGLEPDALANINGPSVLRMPDWAAGKQAAFHMYFGHHKGQSLRLACADRLEGPWAMHPDPVMPLADSLFEPEDPAPDWVDAFGGDYLYAHVASPDAHIDKPNRRVVMYYDGLLRDGDQHGRAAFHAASPASRPALFPHHAAGRRHISVYVGGPAWTHDIMGRASRARPVHL